MRSPASFRFTLQELVATAILGAFYAGILLIKHHARPPDSKTVAVAVGMGVSLSGVVSFAAALMAGERGTFESRARLRYFAGTHGLAFFILIAGWLIGLSVGQGR